VPAFPEARDELRRRAGTDEIPVLVPPSGHAVCGEEEILVYLERFPERPNADQHREKASEEVPQFSEAKAA
jgi:hypothetical protein